MRTRVFPRTGWALSEIGYGMWGMGGWTGSDDRESARALDGAVAQACNFFDTAWAYGEGKSGRLLGDLVTRHPDRRQRPARPRKHARPHGSTLSEGHNVAKRFQEKARGPAFYAVAGPRSVPIRLTAQRTGANVM